MEPHIFDCTLSMHIDEHGVTTIIRVVSVDGSINTTVPFSPELSDLFEDDQYKAKCEGYWDKKENMVWLGKKVNI